MVYNAQNKKAMTLIEVLVVVSIIALLSFAIYTSLSSGIRVWRRSQNVVLEEDIVLFFDRVSRDLHNAFEYSLIKFEGKEDSMSFATIVQVLPDANSGFSQDEYIEQIGKVEYSFDGNNDILLRKEANYSQAVKEKFAAERPVLRSVERVRFRYIYYTDEGEFLSSEMLKTLPAGVEIEVTFSDTKGKRVMRKFVDIPVGA